MTFHFSQEGKIFLSCELDNKKMKLNLTFLLIFIWFIILVLKNLSVGVKMWTLKI